MQLSLSLIEEKLKLQHCEKYLQITQNSKYSEVVIYSRNIKILPGILYVSEGVPENPLDYNQESGFIVLLPPRKNLEKEMPPQAFPCDYLIIHSKICLIDIFNEISSLFISLRRQIDIFKTAAYTQQNLQKLIEMLYDILGNPAYLVDSSFKVLAIDRNQNMRDLSVKWKRLEDDGYLSFDIVSTLITSGELSFMEAKKVAAYIKTELFYTPFINYNLRYQGIVQGHLFVVGMKKNITPSDIELTDYLGEFILYAMMNNPRFQNERGSSYEFFMRDLFSGKLDNHLHIQQQMEFLNYKPNDYYTVVVVHASPKHGLSDERIASQLEQCIGIKPVFYNDRIVSLFSHGNRPDYSKLLPKLYRVNQELGCEIGVSDMFNGFYDVNTYYVQAEWALTSSEVTSANKQRNSEIRYFSNYATQHIIFEYCKRMPWKTLVLPELLYLKKYDEKVQLDLLNTLYIYLQHERSVKAAAEILHIHRNTLTYRINKIVDLCGFRLNDTAIRQRLLLSIEVMKIYS